MPFPALRLPNTEGYSMLYLSQIPVLCSQNWIPYRINSFLDTKLSGEPVPFSRYWVEI